MDKETLTKLARDHLRANMFDGDNAGRVTMKVSTLLDDASEIVANMVEGLVEEGKLSWTK